MLIWTCGCLSLLVPKIQRRIKLGAIPSKLDQGIFIWSIGNKTIGIMISFVDDVLWGGSSEIASIIAKLRETFYIGKEHTQAFTYIGINLKQSNDFTITIDQNSYINSINDIKIDDIHNGNSDDKLTAHELTLLRRALGKINWIAGMSRPEISYHVCEISTRVKNATISEIQAINKIIKYVKSTPSYITIPTLDLESLHLKLYSYASFNNLPDGGSQGGYIIFLCDKFSKSVPLAWNSTRLKCVTRSTLAAETLALTDGCDTTFFIANLITDIGLYKTIPIAALTDNQSLNDTIKATKPTLDRRLRVEISALREMCDKNEINIHWISKQHQLSDVLTKKGASVHNLVKVLQKGKIE